METISVRCRKCGKKMTSSRIDDNKIKFKCSCGFSEYRPGSAASRSINPHVSKDSLIPIKFDVTGEFYIGGEKAERERREIITLDEISMLASSDYDLESVLKGVAEKTAKRLGVDVCSIYVWDGDKLVLRGTFGLSQAAVGRASISIGEGVTGSAVEAKSPQLVPDISVDERYKFFSETKEEQYKIKTMYSYPLMNGDDPVGVLNAQTVVVREFTEDELYFISVIANIVLGAVKMRKKR